MLIAFLLMFLLGSVFEIVPVEAADMSESMETALMEAGEKMSMLIHWLSIPAIMIMGYIGQLLDNKFIFDGHMKDMLRDIWVLMRDIVNVVFVLVLLALAFMNVVKEA